ncbi:MAG: hypothetical protein WA921_07185 [Ahrensia sp.]
MRRFIMLSALAVLVGCQSTPVDTTPILLSAQKLDAVAMDTAYTSLVGLTDENLGSSETAFGPMINRYFLTDDFVVYQHLKVVEPFTPPAPEQSMIDQVMGSAAQTPQAVTTQTFEQLTYFLVNPDGIVTDFASGRLSQNPGRCIQVDAVTELVSTCDDNALLERELASFDQIVRTSNGAMVSSWSTAQPVAPDLAQPVATPPPAAQQ